MTRHQTEAMADELERLALEQAGRNGRSALESLRHIGPLPDSRHTTEVDRETVSELGAKLRQHLGWVEQHLAEMQRSAEQRIRSRLTELGEKERRLGDRAGDLADRSRRGDVATAEEVTQTLRRAESLIHNAGRRLLQGNGRRGLSLSQAAQQALESLERSRTTDPDDGAGRYQGPGHPRDPATGHVPGRSQNSAKGFQRRVLEGLGRDTSDRLRPAVKRYAEGLLR